MSPVPARLLVDNGESIQFVPIEDTVYGMKMENSEMEIIPLSELSETEKEIEKQLERLEQKAIVEEEIIENRELIEKELQEAAQAMVEKKYGKNSKYKYQFYLRGSVNKRIIAKNGPVIIVTCFGDLNMLLDKPGEGFWRQVEDVISQFPNLWYSVALVCNTEIKEVRGRLYKNWRTIPEEKYRDMFPLLPMNSYSGSTNISVTLKHNKTGISVTKSGKFIDWSSVEEQALIELSQKVFEQVYKI